MATLLARKQKALDDYVAALEKLGYKSFEFEADLSSALVMGLGNEHPTEKGFRFDWALGIPFIPATGIKGVVRLAYLVNMLNAEYPDDEQGAQAFCEKLEKDETLPEPVKRIFGYAGEKSALRGGVIFLDAYPEALPRLKAEIMNCHYPDYLNKGQRGPTEDQNPNPQKYWAVDPVLSDGKTRVRFVFRMLLHKSVAEDDGYRAAFDAAVRAALEEHGLGAKTAVAHGRFTTSKARGQEPDTSGDDASRSEPELTAKLPEERVWESATLQWSPGNGILTAAAKEGRAEARGKDLAMRLVPGSLHSKLFEKRKPVKARVTVRLEGYFKIVKIEAGQ